MVIFSGNNGKDTTMAKPKKRVEWDVRLHHYNLKEGNNLHPRVVLRGTLSLEDLAQRVEWRTRGLYKAEETIIVAHKLMEAAIDALVEGYALNTSLGRLTPVVTGMWSFARLSPEARALNKASVSYALSRELKEAFSDPLFHDEVPPDTGPDILSGARHGKQLGQPPHHARRIPVGERPPSADERRLAEAGRGAARG